MNNSYNYITDHHSFVSGACVSVDRVSVSIFKHHLILSNFLETLWLLGLFKGLAPRLSYCESGNPARDLRHTCQFGYEFILLLQSLRLSVEAVPRGGGDQNKQTRNTQDSVPDRE